ncbi:MAG: hypothetical protein ACREUU_20960 [Gammaproteobacteria bacterium]
MDKKTKRVERKGSQAGQSPQSQTPARPRGPLPGEAAATWPGGVLLRFTLPDGTEYSRVPLSDEEFAALKKGAESCHTSLMGFIELAVAEKMAGGRPASASAAVVRGQQPGAEPAGITKDALLRLEAAFRDLEPDRNPLYLIGSDRRSDKDEVHVAEWLVREIRCYRTLSYIEAMNGLYNIQLLLGPHNTFQAERLALARILDADNFLEELQTTPKGQGRLPSSSAGEPAVTAGRKP